MEDKKRGSRLGRTTSAYRLLSAGVSTFWLFAHICNTKGLVDQMSSRREYRFAGRRTRLESPPIVSEHARGAVD